MIQKILKSRKVQRFLVPLFTFVWWNRLDKHGECICGGDCQNEMNLPPNQVLKVKGWRTARIKTISGIATTTFLFNWEDWK